MVTKIYNMQINTCVGFLPITRFISVLILARGTFLFQCLYFLSYVRIAAVALYHWRSDVTRYTALTVHSYTIHWYTGTPVHWVHSVQQSVCARVGRRTDETVFIPTPPRCLRRIPSGRQSLGSPASPANITSHTISMHYNEF